MEKWNGKVALVTGASAGIGAATVNALVKHGMKVISCARNFEKLQELASKLRNEKGEVHPYRCDLRKEEDILAMFEFVKQKFGVLHVCINNAGLAHKASLLEGTTEKWREMIDVNVLALSIVTREAVALMRSANVDDGHVFNINSMSGHRLSSLLMYSATKFAVTALTEGLRRELRGIKSNIRSTSISPGVVETEFNYRMTPNDPKSAEELYKSMKCLQGDEIADAVIYALCAPPHVDVNEIMLRPTEQSF